MNILGAIGRRIFRQVKEYTDAIARGIDTNDDKLMKESIADLLIYLFVRFIIWLIPFLVLFIININIAEMYLTVSGFLALVGIVAACGSVNDDEAEKIEQGPSSVDIGEAEEEAESVHEDLRIMTFNAITDTAENTLLRRPRDEYSIETSRDKPYRMEGLMAIHQFEVDVDGGPIDRMTRDNIWGDLQKHMNRHTRRYSNLVRDGHAPVVYDIKDGGGYLIVEVVLYSEKYKDNLKGRNRARIARQQRAADTYDRDF